MRIIKILSLTVIFVISVLAISINCFAEGFNIGDYFVVGQFENRPIVWRYAADDDNGKLFVSDKILCNKRFGETALWKTSAVRKWLNSSGEGDVSLDAECAVSMYDRALKQPTDYNISTKGFLHNGNFSDSQKNIMKTVSLWNGIGSNSNNESENGVSDIFFSVIKERREAQDPFSTPYVEYYTVNDIPNIYYGAAQQTTDKVFLPDMMQIYTINNNLGSIAQDGLYYLRDGTEDGLACVINGTLSVTAPAHLGRGIRPAFYLNEDAIESISGSGTPDDPYLLNRF